MGIQLYTRGYTVVYTRVHSPLLGSRDTLGMSTPRTQILLPCVCMLLGYLAPSSIVIPCVGSNTIGLESPIGAASCLASHKKEKRKRDPNDREPHRESLMDIPHKGERLKTPREQGGGMDRSLSHALIPKTKHPKIPLHNQLYIKHPERAKVDIPRALRRTRYERCHHLCKVIGAFIICSIKPSRYVHFSPLRMPDIDCI